MMASTGLGYVPGRVNRTILENTRREAEIASKHMQLLSLHVDSPYQDRYSMR